MRLLRTAAAVVPNNNDELHRPSHRRVTGEEPLRSSSSSSSSLLSWPQFSLLPLLLLTMVPLMTLLPSTADAFTTTPCVTKTTTHHSSSPLKSLQGNLLVSSSSLTSSSPRGGRRNMVSMSEVEAPEQSDAFYSGDSEDGPPAEVPELGSDGVYHLMTGEEHKALMEANPDKLVVLKVFAPWCRACKGLEPKFNAIVKDSKYGSLPIVWADLTIQHNKAYVKSLGVLALPSIQFYSHGGIAENFPCGPSKVPILKRKLVQFINANVDATTLTVRDQPAETISEYILEPYRNDTDADGAFSDDDVVVEPAADTTASTTESTTTLVAPAPADATVVEDKKDAIITPRLQSKLRAISYLSPLTESEFETLMSKAKLITFEAGSIIMREGGVGRQFYFITQGEVEVCQKTSFEDPLTTPSTYLGTVINRLDKGDFFGERSLITGELRAASIRASSNLAVKTLAFDINDFPAKCVLSGKAEASFLMAQRADVDEKYGVFLSDTTMMNKQLDDIYMANQVRGSINTPSVIDGVDNDLEVKEVDVKAPKPPQVATDEGSGWRLAADPRSLVPLLVRFKLLRSVNRCFEYIMSNRPVFGEVGALRRRRMLVELLPRSQRSEFKDAFDLVDIDGDGQVTLMELRRSLDAVGEQKSEQELLQLIQRSNGGAGGSGSGGGSIFSAKDVITEQDFMGLMAEAEFFNLFLDTFRALDTQDSGFVRAKDLDRVLCGVRDLISDDRKSIIDVEDQDILIDYEQFSKMLLGRALL